MTYLEKLKDPRWQKRRLEIFEEAGWECYNCGAADKTLHVHHLIYRRGDPWESTDDDLLVLCEDCHSETHAAKKKWDAAFAFVISTFGPDAVESIIKKLDREIFWPNKKNGHS